MRFLTEELYQKKQLFSFLAEDGMNLSELQQSFASDGELDMDDFIFQELLARDEWYMKYLPQELKEKLFDASGEVIFDHADGVLLKEIEVFCTRIAKEWSKAEAKAKQLRQQVAQAATPGMKAFLKLELAGSELEEIQGMDSKEITIKLYPGWDFSKTIWLTFHGVKDSWMGKMHRDDANWWLLDEINIDEQRQDRYELYVLFGHADYVGQLQLSFTDIEVRIEDK